MTIDTELAKLTEVVGAVNFPLATKEVEGDGTLLLRGLAIGWGADRQREEFDVPSVRSAFQKYLASNPVVCVQHNLKQVIGKLTSGKFTPKGVEVTAEIPKPPAGSELESTYNLVKAGVLRSFSIGGKWKKLPSASGVEKLFPIELLETSIAGVGVHPETLFTVVGMKALGNMDDELSRLTNLTTGPSPLDDALERLGAL